MFYRNLTQEAYFVRIAEKQNLCSVNVGSEKQIIWAKRIKADAIDFILSQLTDADIRKNMEQIKDAYGDASGLNDLEQAKIGLMMFTQIVDARTLIELRDQLNLRWFAKWEQNFKTISLSKIN